MLKWHRCKVCTRLQLKPVSDCYCLLLSSSGLNAASAPSSVSTPKPPQTSSTLIWVFGCSTADALIWSAKPLIYWGLMGSTAWTTRYWTSDTALFRLIHDFSILLNSSLGFFLAIAHSGDDTADVRLCSGRWSLSPDVDWCRGQPWCGGKYASAYGHIYALAA